MGRSRARALEVGGRQILALRDGDFLMPHDFMTHAAVHQQMADASGQVRLPIGCFVIPGDEPMLIDAGIGPDLKIDYLPGGRLLDELAQVGYRPEDIRHVALSHLHADHFGWVATKQAGVTFPNAQLYVGAADWAHVLTEQRGPKIPRWTSGPMLELMEIGRVSLLEDETEILPGVIAIAAPGHTPGHMVFAISSRGERALILGDSIYCPQQFSELDWAAAGDVDPRAARQTRVRLARELEGDATLGVGPHFPGLQAGRILSSSWMPSSSLQ